MNGYRRVIYSNGDYCMDHYMDGRRHGLFTMYKDDGSVVKQEHYKNGHKVKL